MAILHSIWLNEVRAARYRRGQGLVDAETALVFDGVTANRDEYFGGTGVETRAVIAGSAA